jgi:hypothetical protein
MMGVVRGDAETAFAPLEQVVPVNRRDDHRVVIDELERPLDDVVTAVAVWALEFDHHADPAGGQLEHLL